MLGQDGKPVPVTDWLLRYDDVSAQRVAVLTSPPATGASSRATATPSWPLEFSVLYRQHQVTLAIRDHTVVVRSGPGALTPIRVRCRGQVGELSNGQTLQFTL